MQRRLQNRDTVILEHVQQGRLAGVVKAQEQELAVLVRQAERGQKVPNYYLLSASALCFVDFPQFNFSPFPLLPPFPKPKKGT